MADNNRRRSKNTSLDKLNKQVNDLYKTTYYSADNSDEMRSQVTNRLDDAIRTSTQGDEELQNISSTSKLFIKLMKPDANNANSKLIKSFGKGDNNDVSSIFQNPNISASILESYGKTKWIAELDHEYDLICRYMTKLQTALDIKRDAVLCSDSYTKKFLNVRAKGENPSSDANSAIQNNIEEMMKKYNLSDCVEKWYEDTSKYGEEFVYCVPYKNALDELLKRKNDTSYSLSESTINSNDLAEKKRKGTASVKCDENGQFSIKITFDKSKVLMESVDNNRYLRAAAGENILRGLSESFVINETNDNFKDHLKKDGKNTVVKFDKTVDDEISWEDEDKTAASGLVDTSKRNPALKVNGAIVRTIDRDRIIPIYIEDTLFGAYYIRMTNINDFDSDLSNMDPVNSMSSIFSNSNTHSTEDESNSHDMMLKKIASEVSNRIDHAFINANVDLKKEIYLMLKFNDTYNRAQDSVDMNIVFIPADDIHHLKFREDPHTHRGISDLWDALVPAKQWITLNLTTILGMTTRGFDRRIYYVKQSLDTNTAQSLLNVVSTIKKGNFGVRQMESVNNILNIVGRYNDFVIPMGPNGEPPIQFDTQPGQQFDFNDGLMTNLEESAVNSTGVPLEIVNSSTGMDFAVRYTMTNAKLLRNVLKRQLKVEDFVSVLFSKIYKFEYNESLELEVTLPPPAFLSMTQGTQLLNSATQYADAITEIEMADQSDAAKTLFKKRIVRKLIPSYMSDAEIQEIKNNIAVDNNINKSANNEEEY